MCLCLLVWLRVFALTGSSNCLLLQNQSIAKLIWILVRCHWLPRLSQRIRFYLFSNKVQSECTDRLISAQKLYFSKWVWQLRPCCLKHPISRPWSEQYVCFSSIRKCHFNIFWQKLTMIDTVPPTSDFPLSATHSHWRPVASLVTHWSHPPIIFHFPASVVRSRSPSLRLWLLPSIALSAWFVVLRLMLDSRTPTIRSSRPWF